MLTKEERRERASKAGKAGSPEGKRRSGLASWTGKGLATRIKKLKAKQAGLSQ